jgi:aminopeptidase-like protein
MINEAIHPAVQLSESSSSQLRMMELLRELFPIARSLTGDGVRETLDIIKRHIPLTVHEVPTGTKVFDWEIPREWNIRGATIKTMDGRTLVDFRANNLHVVGYSVPVSGVFSREELAEHIHTLEEQPDAIPYRTSYYAPNWGFCLPHSLWTTMQDDCYRVEIDTTLADGALTYGELLIPGQVEEEILISVHVCHPSLANDNLSGIVVAVALAAERICQQRTTGVARLGLRLLFVPATIGSITWLARNEGELGRVRHGLVLTCIGDPGPFHYKKSRSQAPIDRVVEHVLNHAGQPFEIVDFSPYGYDERQYGSPSIDLPVGCLMRAVHGTFAQYHTSLDNLDFISEAALAGSLQLVRETLSICDHDRVYERVDGRGEPQLGRRGLYRAIAGQKEAGGPSQMDLLWVLNLSDGRHSVLDIAERAGIPFSRAWGATQICLQADLIKEVSHVRR